MKIICEGIDRLGKSTLINNILKHYGAHPIIHCSSPPKGITDPAKYQYDYFYKCFKILDEFGIDIIFDRCHLGEYIYGPLYRKTDPNFIFNIEKAFFNACNDTRLILLYTDDFSIMKDDGLSFDFDAREKEQRLFFEAFAKSNIREKKLLRVDENGTYRNELEIFNELKQWIDE